MIRRQTEQEREWGSVILEGRPHRWATEWTAKGNEEVSRQERAGSVPGREEQRKASVAGLQ